MGASVHKASCLCKGVQFTVEGQPERHLACYCTDCQKNSGAPCQIAAVFPKENVKIEQGEDLVSTWVIKDTKSGDEKHKLFCKRCGCTLWTIPHAHEGHRYVVRTALIDGGLQLFKPQVELFSSLRPEFMASFQGTKQFDTMPGK